MKAVEVFPMNSEKSLHFSDHLEQALYFRDQLRDARAVALRDAEAFHKILYTFERIGYLLAKEARNLNLNRYKPDIQGVARKSSLAEVPPEHRDWHVPFSELYEVVRIARNDALHQGAYARNLTSHAVQLSLTLEDALMSSATNVGDYMVREPVCALPWQPVSFVRQQMLANSFSYLPVRFVTDGGSEWLLISDTSLARYLRVPEQRNKRLFKTLEEAVDANELQLEEASTCYSDAPIEDVLPLFDGRPLLVCHREDPGWLLGIVTAFDLL
jgi:hypothetical protein